MTHAIAIAGASGRMGQMLVDAVRAADDCHLAAALDRADSPAIGQDAGAFGGQSTGVLISPDMEAGLAHSKFLIDFTRPEGTMAHLAVCRRLGVAMVIGTTGFSEAQKAEIAEAAKDIPIMLAPNMSVGVNVTLKLLELAAKAMATGYDIEIIEAHHLGPKARIQEVQNRVLNTADVLVHRRPIGRALGDHSLAVAWVAVAHVVPARIDKGIHGVGLTPRRFAAHGASNARMKTGVLVQRIARTIRYAIER